MRKTFSFLHGKSVLRKHFIFENPFFENMYFLNEAVFENIFLCIRNHFWKIFFFKHFLKKTFQNICFIIFRFRVSSKNIFWFIVFFFFFLKKTGFLFSKTVFGKQFLKKQIFIKEIFCKQFFSFIKNKFWKQFLYYFENNFFFFFSFCKQILYFENSFFFFLKEKKVLGSPFFKTDYFYIVNFFF